MKKLLFNNERQLTISWVAISNNRLVQTITASWLIVLSAQIVVPFYPVKMTLQTFSIALISLCLPYKVSVESVLLYLGYAAMGLPVLAGGNAGISALVVGPTAGYLWGFLGMAAIISLSMQYYPTDNIMKRFVLCLAGDSMAFLVGIAHLAHLFNVHIAIKTGLLPFLLADIVKMALAAYTSFLISDRYRNT